MVIVVDPAMMRIACKTSVAMTAVIPPLIVHIAARASTRNRLAVKFQFNISLTNTVPAYSTT